MKYAKEQRARFWWDLLECRDSQYGLEKTSWRYRAGEFRYAIRNYVSISPELLEFGMTTIVPEDDKVFVYRVSGCGMTYVGQTGDPYKRYCEHLTESVNSISPLIEAAIDNNVSPTMTVIDVCADSCKLAVEGFWIRWTMPDCLNIAGNETETDAFLRDPESYECAVAKRIVGAMREGK